MEDVLKQLLDAELKAERIVEEAEAKHNQLIAQAREETRAAEARFEGRIPDLRAIPEMKAKERAEQTIAELKRRYDERQREQHAMAERRAPEALEAAVAILLDPERG